MIPIVIICYNNYKYVDNTINQFKKINKEYINYIQIVDNCSTCKDTIDYLTNTTCKVIYNKTNDGPWITPTKNEDIYNQLPSQFIMTDPDLEFNPNLPINFIEILIELSNKYKCRKIGFALDISDFNKMYDDIYAAKILTIYEWEIRFWKNKLDDTNYELYKSEIDTTFCLVNKLYFDTNFDIRIAGNFTCKHLPWYKDNKLFTIHETYLLNKKTTNISGISKLIIPYMEKKYLRITENDELFLLENTESDKNIHFWKNIYSKWENETFAIFDTYLNKDKVFIDIGGWIGTTAMYGSRKSKHVYSVEADTKSFEDMSKNIQINCKKNYTLLNNAIFNVDDIQVKFGKNKFLQNSKLNDSTSQIYNENDTSNDYYLVNTITIKSIISKYNINTSEISLIKVDIEGGEEYILDDLYTMYKEYKIPLYISFHYSWWKNKDLRRFSFLTDHQKNSIYNNPFISLLFN